MSFLKSVSPSSIRIKRWLSLVKSTVVILFSESRVYPLLDLRLLDLIFIQFSLLSASLIWLSSSTITSSGTMISYTLVVQIFDSVQLSFLSKLTSLRISLAEQRFLNGFLIIFIANSHLVYLHQTFITLPKLPYPNESINLKLLLLHMSFHSCFSCLSAY